MGFEIKNEDNNQLHVDYDASKIISFGNRFNNASLLNASGGVKSFAPGLVIASVAPETTRFHPVSGSLPGTVSARLPFPAARCAAADGVQMVRRTRP